MKRKPVVLRARAEQDLREVVDYYVNEGDEQTALAFINALERAFQHIGRHPRSGATRYAHELDLPGLRFWPVSRHPYLVFYIEQADDIDVWRVLHAHRDIPAAMQDPFPPA